jgi:hypothetical protein
LRSVLVAALASCTEGPLQSEARRFLAGLSRDELQFIADYLGASILEAAEPRAGSRLELARRIAAFQRTRSGNSLPPSSPDLDHKTILLLEFLCRAGLQKQTVAVRAARAS